MFDHHYPDMFTVFQPEINRPIFFPRHVLLWIRTGNGLLEVDFRTYPDLNDKLIFLAPGQYLKFIYGEFEVAKLEFPTEYVSHSPDYRVLFRHLISLGYIEYPGSTPDLFSDLFRNPPQRILDWSAKRWYRQNPFNARREEYTIIFDLKEVIDEHFREQLSVDHLIGQVQHDQVLVRRLLKERLGLTVKNMALQKLILESQKDLAFSDKPVQEIAYGLGFRDPAYFNRLFKKKTRRTPLEFRDDFGDQNAPDLFIRELLQLIRENHRWEHSTSFYADRTCMSIKTLSRKVKAKLNLTVGDLIRREIIESAKHLLPELPVREVAFELGFQESSHFSTFFKKYAGINPSEFQAEKYNS